MISYKPFQKMLIDKEMKKQEIVNNIGLSWATMAKLNSNQYVSLEVIDKLCDYLQCQPGDLIEFIKENEKIARH